MQACQRGRNVQPQPVPAPALPRHAEVLPVTTIAPPPAAIIAGASSCASTNSEVTFTRKRCSRSSGFTVSYVTGEHVFKTGFLLRYFHTGDASRNTDPNQINQGRDYTFRNGVPTNVRIWAVPYAWEEDGRDYSFFVQDQWTMGSTTLNMGVRYNDTATSLPEVHLAPGFFVGARVLPARLRAISASSGYRF